MAFVRILAQLVKDKEIGPRIVPIIPDEARTFGMEGMFRQLGIYSSVGQLYEPVDKDQVMFYREDKKGQILQKASTKPAPCLVHRCRYLVLTTTSRCCRSTSSTRCSASSVSATWPGPLATAAPVAS
jgi:hypothetical protein